MILRASKLAVLISVVTVTVLVGGGLVLLGRSTASNGGSADRAKADRANAQRANADSQSALNAAYLDGLRAGEAEGRQEGRALQATKLVPASSQQVAKDAFNQGYSAGANDIFGDYDGGWELSVPYVITLERGTGEITYRVKSRTLFEPKINYYLCSNGHDACQQPKS
ncbi:hypothetical protein ACSMXN_09090 [Jatrophihabitans sp. DSM 45814]